MVLFLFIPAEIGHLKSNLQKSARFSQSNSIKGDRVTCGTFQNENRWKFAFDRGEAHQLGLFFRQWIQFIRQLFRALLDQAKFVNSSTFQNVEFE